MVFRSSSSIQRDSLASQIASLSILDDPVRAAIFTHVAGSGDYVTRDHAARTLGITRRTAAFHLDKLAEAGLLEITFRRLTGRTGPGAGRSSKLYRRSGRSFTVSIPPRNYELMARLLASVAQKVEGASAAHVFEPQARAFGVSMGVALREQVDPRPSQRRLLAMLINELTGLGFEPFTDVHGTLRLRNCPYHEMSREDANFVCSMNLALMQGVIEGFDLGEISAALEPTEAMCCVAFRAKPETVRPADTGTGT